MKIEEFKTAEEAVAKVLKAHGLKAYAVTVHEFQVKYMISRDGKVSATYRTFQEEALEKVVEELEKELGPKKMSAMMNPGDQFYSPYLIVYSIERGVWP